MANKTLKDQRAASIEIEDALAWMAEDLGFQKNSDADIRCAFLIPIGRKRDGQPTMMMQLTNYVPLRGKISGTKGIALRRNGRANRVFRVFHQDETGERIIGIVGKTVAESLRQKKALFFADAVPDHKTAAEYAIEEYNYSSEQAANLTQDRRSYLCLVLMNQHRDSVIGVVYCDSSKKDALNNRKGAEALGFLPRIARKLQI